MFAVTGEEKCSREKELQNNIRNKANWLTLHDFNEKDSINVSCLEEPVELMSKPLTEENKDENKSELYDSAYDTLLTQRSSRSIRPSSSSIDQSDLENASSLQKKSSVDDSVILRNVGDKMENKEKRHSTFFVIPGDVVSGNEERGKPEVWEDSSAEPEIEYEYEYEVGNQRFCFHILL